MPAPYVGRFAPSPSGPLHAGSLVAALGSWLDARCAGGRWLLRIEDVDSRRCSPQAARRILQQLAECGLHADGAVIWQSRRTAAYAQALQRLRQQRLAYACSCSRADLLRAGACRSPSGELLYPGSCRNGPCRAGGAPLAWRLRLPPAPQCQVRWHCARLGEQFDGVERQVGDFVLRRADGDWAYQLAVVVDDAAQGVTEVVRGEDLAASTARQLLLQRALELPTPGYLHLPLLRDAAGRKLSKSRGDAPFVPGAQALRDAALVLGLHLDPGDVQQVLAQALQQWPRLRADWARRAASRTAG